MSRTKKIKINNLSTEHEILQILQEECAEVIQEASKCVRFGTKDNMARLERELGQLVCIMDIMHKHDMISFTALDNAIAEKYEKLEIYSNILK